MEGRDGEPNESSAIPEADITASLPLTTQNSLARDLLAVGLAGRIILALLREAVSFLRAEKVAKT